MRHQLWLLLSVQGMKRGLGMQQREGGAEGGQAEVEYPDDRTARRRAIEQVRQPCCACCACCACCLAASPAALTVMHPTQASCLSPVHLWCLRMQLLQMGGRDRPLPG